MQLSRKELIMWSQWCWVLLTVDGEENVDLRSADAVPGLTDELPAHVPGERAELEDAGLHVVTPAPPQVCDPLQSSQVDPTPPDLRPRIPGCPAVDAELPALVPLEVRPGSRLGDEGGLEHSQTVSHWQRPARPLQLTGVVTCSQQSVNLPRQKSGRKGPKKDHGLVHTFDEANEKNPLFLNRINNMT